MNNEFSAEHIERLKTWLGSGSINFFGSPFSGKDTQARRLADLLHAPVIGGGEIIRSSNNERVKAIINQGKLAPTQDYLDMVLPYLSRPEYSGKPLILSSVGRWHGEEAAIVQAAKESNHPIKAVVFLNIPENEVVKRWETAQELKDRGEREDDTFEALSVRLDEFRNKTKPVIDYYRDQGLLVDIDGAQTPDEVTHLIFSALLERAMSETGHA